MGKVDITCGHLGDINTPIVADPYRVGGIPHSPKVLVMEIAVWSAATAIYNIMLLLTVALRGQRQLGNISIGVFLLPKLHLQCHNKTDACNMFCSCRQAKKHPVLMNSSSKGMLLSLVGPCGDSRLTLEASFREAEIFDTVTLPAYMISALGFFYLGAIFMMTSTANVVLIWAILS